MLVITEILNLINSTLATKLQPSKKYNNEE